MFPFMVASAAAALGLPARAGTFLPACGAVTKRARSWGRPKRRGGGGGGRGSQPCSLQTLLVATLTVGGKRWKRPCLPQPCTPSASRCHLSEESQWGFLPPPRRVLKDIALWEG